MLGNSWFKKEKPLFGLFGLGGGVGSSLVSSAPVEPVVASGGTKITVGSYSYHVIASFTPAPLQNFAVDPTSGDAECDWLVLGGGGGGGCQHSGGGGAGGLRSSQGPGGPSPSSEATVTIPAGTTCPITIGTGGNAGNPGPNGNCPHGGNGNHTIWTIPTGSPIRSEGGGGGSSWDPNAGSNGASGGGGNGQVGSAGGLGNMEAGTTTPVPNQGYAGGSAPPTGHGGLALQPQGPPAPKATPGL